MDEDFEKRLRVVEMPHSTLAEVIKVWLLTHKVEFPRNFKVVEVFEDPWTKRLMATVYSPDFEPSRQEGQCLESIAVLR